MSKQLNSDWTVAVADDQELIDFPPICTRMLYGGFQSPEDARMTCIVVQRRSARGVKPTYKALIFERLLRVEISQSSVSRQQSTATDPA